MKNRRTVRPEILEEIKSSRGESQLDESLAPTQDAEGSNPSTPAKSYRIVLDPHDEFTVPSNVSFLILVKDKWIINKKDGISISDLAPGAEVDIAGRTGTIVEIEPVIEIPKLNLDKVLSDLRNLVIISSDPAKLVAIGPDWLNSVKEAIELLEELKQRRLGEP